jgi:hypothetical protein
MADSATGFWSMIGAVIIAGIIWLVGARELINRIMGRKDE